MTARKGGALFLCTTLAYLVMCFMMWILPLSGGFLDGIVFGIAVSESSIFIPAAVFALCTEERFGTMFPFRRIGIRQAVLSAVLITVVFPAVNAINTVSLCFTDNAADTVVDMAAGESPALVIIMVGIIGPVIEELAFRGYIFQSLRRSGRILPAAILSGIAFGCMHMNINQALYATVLGVFFALAVEFTGSLWASVIMHCLFNSAEVVMMYLPVSVVSSENEQLSEEFYSAGLLQIFLLELPVILISLLLGAAVLFLLYRIGKKKGVFEGRAAVSEKHSPMSACLAAGFFISVLFMAVLQLFS